MTKAELPKPWETVAHSQSEKPWGSGTSAAQSCHLAQVVRGRVLRQALLVLIVLLSAATNEAAAAQAEGYTIFGQVLTQDAKPLEGVTINLTGGLRDAVTDHEGTYAVSVPGDVAKYALTPEKAGYTFSPQRQRSGPPLPMKRPSSWQNLSRQLHRRQ